jgi:hypothetical protein
LFLVDSNVEISLIADMIKLSLTFLVLLVTTTYAQLDSIGRGYANGYYIGPYANLRGANLTGADLTGANLSGANLSGANVNGADLDGSIWSNVISQSDYNAVVAERDAAIAAKATVEAERDTALAAQASAEAERDARPTQAAYDAVVAERDARPTQASYDALVAENSEKYNLKDIADLREGSKMIEISNGEATISMEVEKSDELGSWTVEGNLSTTISVEPVEDKKFFRFKMNNSDFDGNDITLSVGDTEYDEAAIKAALAEQYGVPIDFLTLEVTNGN